VAKKTSAKKLILWDIDGTLIVSHGAGVRAMELALTKRFGVTCDLRQIDWAGPADRQPAARRGVQAHALQGLALLRVRRLRRRQPPAQRPRAARAPPG
jgi:phosphoglycolate phosphatase-like HAD superfamily hydrolase